MDITALTAAISRGETRMIRTRYSSPNLCFSRLKRSAWRQSTNGSLTPCPIFSLWLLRPCAMFWLYGRGLGYNRRAVALKKTGQTVVDEHGGKLPDDVLTLKTFPGIGITTASEIAAFAFHRPVVFIETNIRRVFLHFFFRDSEGIRDKDLLPLVEKTLDRSDPRNWYYALMDFGVMLKRVVINPNRRSAHYTRQSRFEGSDRQIRGEILRLLLAREEVFESKAAILLDADEARVERILGELKKEGFHPKYGRQARNPRRLAVDSTMRSDRDDGAVGAQWVYGGITGRAARAFFFKTCVFLLARRVEYKHYAR